MFSHGWGTQPRASLSRVVLHRSPVVSSSPCRCQLPLALRGERLHSSSAYLLISSQLRIASKSEVTSELRHLLFQLLKAAASTVAAVRPLHLHTSRSLAFSLPTCLLKMIENNCPCSVHVFCSLMCPSAVRESRRFRLSGRQNLHLPLCRVQRREGLLRRRRRGPRFMRRLQLQPQRQRLCEWLYVAVHFVVRLSLAASSIPSTPESGCRPARGFLHLYSGCSLRRSACKGGAPREHTDPASPLLSASLWPSI